MRISDWSSDVCSSDLQGKVISPREHILCNDLRIKKRQMEHQRNRTQQQGEGDWHPKGHESQQGNDKNEDVHVARSPRCCRQKRSEEHTSELQSLMRISYAVFCLKKKKTIYKNQIPK